MKMIFASCNICGSAEFQEIFDIRISPIWIESKLVKCKQCGFFYANPRLEEKREEEHYERDYYENEELAYWDKERSGFFNRASRMIRKLIKVGKLLDIGCGMGYFMDLCRRNSWDVKGIEISDFAVNYAKEKLGLDVIKSELKDVKFGSEFFDVVTMWNVLDQVYDPKATLFEVNRILKKGGYAFIRVSNLNLHLMQAKLFKKPFFSGFKLSPYIYVFHLYNFNKKSIEKLLNLTDFSNVIVKPSLLYPGNIQLTRAFGERKEKAIRVMANFVFSCLYLLTFGRVIFSPSLFVIARKQ